MSAAAAAWRSRLPVVIRPSDQIADEVTELRVPLGGEHVDELVGAHRPLAGEDRHEPRPSRVGGGGELLAQWTSAKTDAGTTSSARLWVEVDALAIDAGPFIGRSCRSDLLDPAAEISEGLGGCLIEGVARDALAVGTAEQPPRSVAVIGLDRVDIQFRDRLRGLREGEHGNHEDASQNGHCSECTQCSPQPGQVSVGARVSPEVGPDSEDHHKCAKRKGR